MGDYFRVTPDLRDLNYDNFAQYDVTKKIVQSENDYNSHNTNLLDVEGTIKKIMTTDYVRDQLNNWEKKY